MIRKLKDALPLRVAASNIGPLRTDVLCYTSVPVSYFQLSYYATHKSLLQKSRKASVEREHNTGVWKPESLGLIK
jgi:hypothetical protein